MAKTAGAAAHTAVNDILVRLDERAHEAKTLAINAVELADEERVTRTQLDRLGGPAAGHSAAHAPLRDALLGLVALGHDIEIVVREITILQRSNINLAKLFEPKEINYGLGNRFRAEQDGPARLVHAHETHCLVADAGHLCIDVPLKIEKLGVIHRPHVNFTLAIDNIPGHQDAFQRVLARGAHFCPLDGLEEALVQLLLEEIRPELASITGRMPLPRLPDLQVGKIDLYAGMLGDLVRVHGHSTRRERRRVAPLATLSSWVDTAVKIVPDLIVDQIRREIAKTGAAIVAGPSYIGSNAFDLGARFERGGTRTIGCKRFGFRILADFTIRVQLRIESLGSRITLVIDTFDVDRKVDVIIEPQIIDWLLNELTRAAEDWLEDNLPGVRNTRRIDLPMARRAAVSVSPDRYLLEMQTRQLFQA